MIRKTEPGGPQATELAELIASSAWFLNVLTAVRDAGLPDAWAGAGALRDLVWGQRYGGGFDPQDVRDVDVPFFDPTDLTHSNDVAATELLKHREPTVPWEATNQAALHTWYEHVFGTAPVDALRSTAAMAAGKDHPAVAVQQSDLASDRCVSKFALLHRHIPTPGV